MRRGTLEGYLDYKVEEHPIYKKLNLLENKLNLENHDLKFYFILNKYIYEFVNEDTNERKLDFDSGFYCKEYDLTYKREDEIEVFKKHSIRLLSLHYLILREMVPFVTIGVTKDGRFRLPATNLRITNNYLLFDIKERWNFLNNDFEILEDYISADSSLQQVLAWYTFAKLSYSKVDSFMNYYRCLEEFSRDCFEDRVTKLKNFVENEFSDFDQVTKDQLAKLNKQNFISYYLKSLNVDNVLIKKIDNLRNKKIAHGSDYEIEYSGTLPLTLEEMDQLIYDIICRKIKEMNIPNLKSPQFLIDYTLVFNISKCKIALADEIDALYLFKELKKMQPSVGVNELFGIGRISKDALYEEILSEKFGQNHIIIDDDLYNKLIENFGRFVDHNFETHI